MAHVALLLSLTQQPLAVPAILAPSALLATAAVLQGIAVPLLTTVLLKMAARLPTDLALLPRLHPTRDPLPLAVSTMETLLARLATAAVVQDTAVPPQTTV